VHSYVWIEAVRSFHQALRLDPDLAMAYLGLTDAFIGLQDVGTARATLERAKALEKGMNERERAWLSIREGELQFAEDKPNGSGDSACASHARARIDENGADRGSDCRISEDEGTGRKLLSIREDSGTL